MRPLLLVMSAVFAAVLMGGTLLAIGNLPTSRRASVNAEQEAADAERIENIQRIKRELIEFGKSQGLRQHGYENLVVVSPPNAWDDPDLVTKLMTERTGESEATASLREPIVYSAMMLANMGMLGGDTGNADLYSGPMSVEERLDLIQQFMESREPGTYIRPEVVYAEVFQRLQKTDINAMTIGPNDPGSPYNQIAITNAALVTATGFLSEDGQQHQVALLMSAEDDYLFGVAKGEMTMIYPEYLASIKAQR